jgi:iron-sulfur cluster repair protein YtfE (RIC family)
MYQIECELCNKVWCGNSVEAILKDFEQHLKEHNHKELEVLRKLAKLELDNPQAYEELKETLTEFDYEVWRKMLPEGTTSKKGSGAQ